VVAAISSPLEHFLRSAQQPEKLPNDPVTAFDELYLRQARPLTQQAFVLCGHRRVAERAVRWAFHQAWQHWPQVLAASVPTRTVRTSVYEYALSPWHQFHPCCRRPQPYPGRPADRTVLEAFLGLPRSYRAALLLHYGLGLSLPETAAEAECSFEAAAGRITHGRAALEECWPMLAHTPRWQRGAVLARTLRELAVAQPVRPIPPRLVRRGSLRTTQMWTRASIGLTATVTAATAFTLLTAHGDGGRPEEPVKAPTHTSDALQPERPHERSAGGPGNAYLPQLRSTNERVHMDDFRHHPHRPPNIHTPEPGLRHPND
jgi:DNA-directed RNA polymerase specialized sigma24 family protein